MRRALLWAGALCSAFVHPPPRPQRLRSAETRLAKWHLAKVPGWLRMPYGTSSKAAAPTVAPPHHDDHVIKPEGEALSVVASSVMALGVLPGDELRVLLDGVCESLPPEAFKGLIVAIGHSLSAQQHKAIVNSIAPRLTAILLGNTTSMATRENGKMLVTHLVHKRVAKMLVNRWVRQTDAASLKGILKNALQNIPLERLESIAPLCVEAIVGGTSNTTLRQRQRRTASVAAAKAARDAQPADDTWLDEGLDDAVAAYAWPRLMLAAPSKAARRRVVERFISRLDDADAPVLLNALVDRDDGGGGTVAGVLHVALKNSSEAELARSLPMRVKAALVRDRTAKQFDPSLVDSVMALLGDGSVNPERAAWHANRLGLSKQTLRGACRALSSARVSPVPGLSPWLYNVLSAPFYAAPQVPWARNTNFRGDSRHRGEWQEATRYAVRNATRVVQRLNPIKPKQPTTADVVRDTVETLPPALVAKQLTAILERLPPEFVRDEAVALLGSLQGGDLVEIAARLIDAAPEATLRSLAAKLLTQSAKSRNGTTATTLTSLAIASSTYDVELLRSTARTLLGGAPPDALAARAQELVRTADPARIRRSALDALDAATDKARAFGSLKEMLASSKKQRGNEARSPLSSTRKQRAAAPGEKASPNFLKSGLEDAGGKLGGLLSTVFKKNRVEIALGPEARLLASLRELPPEFLAEKALETLGALPAETFESVARLLVLASWERLVVTALPPQFSASLQDAVELLSDAYNGTLIASTGLSAAGGIAGGAAIQSALSPALVAIAKVGVAKAGVAAAFVLKGTLLTSIVYAGRVALQSHDAESEIWVTCAEDAALALGFFSAASSARAYADSELSSPSNAARLRDAGARSRAALRILFRDQRRTTKLLKSAGRKPLGRNAAAALACAFCAIMQPRHNPPSTLL
ncbi:hypothetical protein M885DRAFT_524862 [Pelagophyceae sp. CCMP2097]|nr:hypothetical protein M885DRAFT_524862 [Pelagophyceae sp. CCMP2097]